ncbi:MAG: hypothetical protein RLZZ546_1335 [Bacteroidota bacterium]|jgi:hypothetical protein
MTEIEEAAANLADPNLCKTDNWIAGAKWQQEQELDRLKEAYSMGREGKSIKEFNEAFNQQ